MAEKRAPRVQSFRLLECRLETSNQHDVPVSFVSDEASDGTHITLLMGSNGTSKSRLLAACVESLLGAHESPRHRKRGSPSFWCSMVRSSGGDESGKPARILALSNLVRDRFPFLRSDEMGDFYRYLGVRQGTNLTTTGALDQSVGEAVISAMGDAAKLGRLRSWLHIFFPEAEIGIGFPRISRAQMQSYVDGDDGLARLARRLAGPGSSFRRASRMDEDPGSTAELAQRAQLLFRLVLGDQDAETVADSLGRDVALVSLERAGPLAEIARTYDGLRQSAAGRMGVRPSLYIYSKSWIGFDQLSSGEQNLLSVGAKLIAYAVPQSLILIDEPEVSLNVSWQQRYIDLIRESLAGASGCHVIIATHSPHFISGLDEAQGSIVVVRRMEDELSYDMRPAAYEAWGSEAVLYEVLDVPSASSFAFNKELVKVLSYIQAGLQDPSPIDTFLMKVERLHFDENEPLGEVVREIRKYREALGEEA